jgi:hypothetical protein
MVRLLIFSSVIAQVIVPKALTSQKKIRFFVIDTPEATRILWKKSGPVATIHGRMKARI